MTVLRFALVLLLAGAPAIALGQTKGADPKAATGCAKYTDADKRATCQAKEARTARDAERKRVDKQRAVERACAKSKDEKARVECEKKELAKQTK
jgi:hypothetical protein